MRLFELSSDDLIERMQALTIDILIADKSIAPSAACIRAAECLHLIFDEDVIQQAFRDAAFRLGSRGKQNLSILLIKPKPPEVGDE